MVSNKLSGPYSTLIFVYIYRNYLFNKSLYIPFFKTDDDYPKKKTTKNTRDDSKAKVGIVSQNGGDARFIIPVRLRTLKLYVGECENTEVVIVCVFCS